MAHRGRIALISWPGVLSAVGMCSVCPLRRSIRHSINNWTCVHQAQQNARHLFIQIRHSPNTGAAPVVALRIRRRTRTVRTHLLDCPQLARARVEPLRYLSNHRRWSRSCDIHHIEPISQLSCETRAQNARGELTVLHSQRFAAASHALAVGGSTPHSGCQW